MATEEATKYTVYKYTLGLLTYERGRYRQADRRGERDKATERLRERERVTNALDFHLLDNLFPR